MSHTSKIQLSKHHFNSTAGLSTKHWGPSGWHFLFSCIMGGFPPIIVPNNKQHIKIKKHFKNMFHSLAFTMPCIFCRESYKKFLKQLPIDPFLSDRIQLMKWLYLIRDKVNQKLINQENECYKTEKRLLQKKYYSKQITKPEYHASIEKIKSEIFITKMSPDFIEVLQKYESIRAVCSNKAKTCALPKQK
jgi:hypothetical protein